MHVVKRRKEQNTNGLPILHVQLNKQSLQYKQITFTLYTSQLIQVCRLRLKKSVLMNCSIQFVHVWRTATCIMQTCTLMHIHIHTYSTHNTPNALHTVTQEGMQWHTYKWPVYTKCFSSPPLRVPKRSRWLPCSRRHYRWSGLLPRDLMDQSSEVVPISAA